MSRQVLGLEVQNAASHMAYEKILKLSIHARETFGVAEVVNLLSTDLQRVQLHFTFGKFLISSLLKSTTW